MEYNLILFWMEDNLKFCLKWKMTSIIFSMEDNLIFLKEDDLVFFQWKVPHLFLMEDNLKFSLMKDDFQIF